MTTHGGQPDAADQIKIEARRQKAVDMRSDGATWDEVAQACDYNDRGHACMDLTRAAAQARRKTHASIEEWREAEDAKLDELEAVAWRSLAAQGVHVSTDKEGRVTVTRIDDPELALKATDRLVKIAQRRAALRGLDSPVKIEQSGVVRYTVDGVDMSKLS